MADNNVGGHLAVLLSVCRSPGWHDVWAALAVTVYDFEALKLRRDLPDSELWAACQAHGVLLITANRNSHGPDSLEATIRIRGTAHSLPVLTLADAARIRTDRAYAERAAERLIEICLDIDLVRGSGRLYLPP